MKIRLLQTVPSLVPDHPFQPGQIIDVPTLTPEIRTWLKTGKAVVLEAVPELAVVEARERAVLPRGKRRKP